SCLPARAKRWMPDSSKRQGPSPAKIDWARKARPMRAKSPATTPVAMRVPVVSGSTLPRPSSDTTPRASRKRPAPIPTSRTCTVSRLQRIGPSERLGPDDPVALVVTVLEGGLRVAGDHPQHGVGVVVVPDGVVV